MAGAVYLLTAAPVMRLVPQNRPKGSWPLLSPNIFVAPTSARAMSIPPIMSPRFTKSTTRGVLFRSLANNA